MGGMAAVTYLLTYLLTYLITYLLTGRNGSRGLPCGCGTHRFGGALQEWAFSPLDLLSHARTHSRTHARTHSRTHALTHARSHLMIIDSLTTDSLLFLPAGGSALRVPLTHLAVHLPGEGELPLDTKDAHRPVTKLPAREHAQWAVERGRVLWQLHL